MQYRVEEPSGGAATPAPWGRGRALHTTPAVRRGQAPRNSAAAPAAVALRCTQSQTMLNMRGTGQGAAALLRQATYRTPPPTGTAWVTRLSEGAGAAHLRRGGGGGLS